MIAEQNLTKVSSEGNFNSKLVSELRRLHMGGIEVKRVKVTLKQSQVNLTFNLTLKHLSGKSLLILVYWSELLSAATLKYFR